MKNFKFLTFSAFVILSFIVFENIIGMEDTTLSDALRQSRCSLRNAQQALTNHQFGDLCKSPAECHRCDNYQQIISENAEEIENLNKKRLELRTKMVRHYHYN